MKFAILANEIENDHINWILTLEQTQQKQYTVVHLTQPNWIENILKFGPDICLAKPGAFSNKYKSVFDSRVRIIDEIFKIPIFPSANEIYIYENKSFFSEWLRANKIPHPETHLFYHYREATEYIQTCNYPIVGKMNIGASGNGIKIIHDLQEAKRYVKNIFTVGISLRSGPRFDKPDFFKRFIHQLAHPKKLKVKLTTYKTIASDRQKGYVILQKFIPHDFEWRVVRIGDSFFAHKKLKLGEKTSGSLIKSYENPPLSLLDFVKEVTDKHQFYSQAVDIFESDEKYLVNEMQCIFGQSDPYQMKVDGKIGRYIWIDNKWVFEAGDFAKNACYDLRMEFLINQVTKSENTIRQ